MGTCCGTYNSTMGPAQMQRQIPEHLKDEIDELAEDGFKQWNNNATPVQKAIGSAECDRWLTDSEFAAKQQKFMQDAFESADKHMNFVLSE